MRTDMMKLILLPFFWGGGGDSPISEVACNCFMWKTVQLDSVILGTGPHLYFCVTQRTVISTSWEGLVGIIEC